MTSLKLIGCCDVHARRISCPGEPFLFLDPFKSGSFFRPRTPSDMLQASKATQESFSLHFDRLGDSYFDEIDVEALKSIMARIKPEVSRYFILFIEATTSNLRDIIQRTCSKYINNKIQVCHL